MGVVVVEFDNSEKSFSFWCCDLFIAQISATAFCLTLELIITFAWSSFERYSFGVVPFFSKLRLYILNRTKRMLDETILWIFEFVDYWLRFVDQVLETIIFFKNILFLSLYYVIFSLAFGITVHQQHFNYNIKIKDKYVARKNRMQNLP